ncbi:hypothetical protein CWO90_34825 [Bradyrhizobium sp. Leo121]|nr:hypothetical protein CWO90_34825 [Bradyrhizobium sp. Leo121]
MAIALILLTFLAVEPWIACFPLNWRIGPQVGAVAGVRHGELIDNRRHHALVATQKNRNYA